MKTAISVLFICFAFSPVLGGESRTWTDIQGKQAMAEFVRRDRDEVVLRRPSDGKEFTVPLRRLSADDRAWLIEHSPNKIKEAILRDTELTDEIGQVLTQLIALGDKDNAEKAKLQSRMTKLAKDHEQVEKIVTPEFLKFLPNKEQPFAGLDQSVDVNGRQLWWRVKREGTPIVDVLISTARQEEIDNAKSILYGVPAWDKRADDGTGAIYLILSRHMTLMLDFRHAGFSKQFLDQADIRGLVQLGW